MENQYSYPELTVWELSDAANYCEKHTSLCPELRVRELSDAVNHNSKVIVVHWAQGSRTLRCCKLLWKSYTLKLRVWELSDAVDYNTKAITARWAQGSRPLSCSKFQRKGNYCTLNSGFENSQMLYITIVKQFLYPELRVRSRALRCCKLR